MTLAKQRHRHTEAKTAPRTGKKDICPNVNFQVTHSVRMKYYKLNKQIKEEQKPISTP